MIFVLFFNFATLIFFGLFPDLKNYGSGMDYYSQLDIHTNTTTEISEISADLQTFASIESNNFFDGLLGWGVLSFVGKLLNILDNLLFGIVNIINTIFPMHSTIIIALKGILSIFYVLGFVSLFSGRQLE
jgi:hypothetical protein